jgi:hypothetical protein
MSATKAPVSADVSYKNNTHLLYFESRRGCIRWMLSLGSGRTDEAPMNVR